jgi:HlyD family secretion protein
MSKFTSTPAAALSALLLAGAVGLFVQYASTKRGADSMSATAQSAIVQPAQPATKAGSWAASAPGRVEPKNGEYRIGTQAPGRVVEIAVQMNDRVAAGDLLVRVDDEDAQAKLTGIEAETAVRKRERDAETVGRLAQDRRTAEDAVANAERALFQARRDLDRATVGRRSNATTEDDAVKARAAVAAAKEKLEAERQALRRVQATAGMPLPTRLESALATARAELTLAESAIERARSRSASDGTVLQVLAKIGETVAPGPDQALVMIGDLTGLRVRAEVEERDVSKVRAGQKVVIRSDAFPGRDFAGTVTSLGQSLAPPRLASRGPRRPTDLDALEVLIDVDGPATLMPGMRADVFFAPNANGQAVAPATPAPVKTN